MDTETLIVIGIGIVVGIPLSALAYWYTKRNQKLGYGSGFGGDYSSMGSSHFGGGDGGGGGDSGGGDSGS